MKLGDVLASMALAAEVMPFDGGKKSGENPYRLRNKTAHGIARKAKNKAAKASRKRNRQKS